MRFFVIAGLGIVFLGWVLYRLLIKRDLKDKKNLDLLKFGGFFFSVWALIYFVIIWM